MKLNCNQCGVCCKLFLINLSEEEYDSGNYKTVSDNFKLNDKFIDIESYGGNILEQNEDGSCVYLKDSKCSIHNYRPKVCGIFFCNSKNKKFTNMIEKINKNKLN